MLHVAHELLNIATTIYLHNDYAILHVTFTPHDQKVTMSVQKKTARPVSVGNINNDEVILMKPLIFYILFFL